MTRNDKILFKHEDSYDYQCSDGETYHSYQNLYIFKKVDKDGNPKSGYGYRYEVPFSEVTIDPDVDEGYYKDITWDEFYRMKLTTNMRDILDQAGFKPEEEDGKKNTKN